MKKHLLTLIMVIFAAQIQAQDANIINTIKNANKGVKSIAADISNTITKSDKSTTKKGSFYYVSPSKLAALFTTGNHMIINETRVNIEMGIFHGTFKLRDGGRIQSLCNIFLYGFQGKCQELADENTYNLNVEEEGNYYKIIGSTKKKKLLGIGYKDIIYKYGKQDLLLKEIMLIDYKGNVDTYTISNIRYNEQVDNGHFLF